MNASNNSENYYETKLKTETKFSIVGTTTHYTIRAHTQSNSLHTVAHLKLKELKNEEAELMRACKAFEWDKRCPTLDETGTEW